MKAVYFHWPNFASLGLNDNKIIKHENSLMILFVIKAKFPKL